MQIISLLFQNSKQPLIQKREIAQQKIDQLDQQLLIVGLICPKGTHLQPIKAKLQTEREFWVAELKQAEAVLEQRRSDAGFASVGGGFGDQLRQLGGLK